MSKVSLFSAPSKLWLIFGRQPWKSVWKSANFWVHCKVESWTWLTSRYFFLSRTHLCVVTVSDLGSSSLETSVVCFPTLPPTPSILLMFVFLTTMRTVNKYLDWAAEKTFLQIPKIWLKVSFFPTRIFSSFAQFSAPPPAHTHQLARSASCLLFLLRKLPPNKSPTEATNFRRLKKYPQICQSRRKRSISGKEKWWQVSKNISSRTQYFCWKGIFSKFSFFQIYG